MNSLLLLNRDLLQQLWTPLEKISETNYQNSDAASFEASIGDHVRHVLDHYQCFLEGLPKGKINYDHRRRENLIATDPAYARQEIGRFNQLLVELGEEKDRPLKIFSDDMEDQSAASSLSRELLFLLSHTIHHCALIRPQCQRLKIALSDSFGMAPSTLTHLETKSA